MCIRDSAQALERELKWIRMSSADRHELNRTRLSEYEQMLAKEAAAQNADSATIQIAPGPEPVSYTHLTLPTSDLV